jgi:tRNA uridine 5-carboxymethylaminomethyl modification enzyme
MAGQGARQDDADARLTAKSYAIGLATKERMELYNRKKEAIANLVGFIKGYSIQAKYINSFLEKCGTTALTEGCKLVDLVARPQLNFRNLSEIVPELRELIESAPNRKEEIAEAAEIRIKYKGYIEREKQVADKMHRLENIKIKGHFDYNTIQSLSTECRQKLTAIDPDTLAQASRIPGVSPSDINVLLVLMGR